MYNQVSSADFVSLEQTIQNNMEIPKWKDLDNFLTSRFQTLETVSEIRNIESVGSSSRPALEDLSNLKMVVRSFSISLNRRIYTYCSGDHLMNIYPKFLYLSPVRRLSALKRYSLCIKSWTQ